MIDQESVKFQRRILAHDQRSKMKNIQEGYYAATR